MMSSLLFLAFPVLIVASGVYDLFTMTIPNWLSGLLAALFVVAALAVGLPANVLGLHVAAGLLVLVVGFTCFALGWIGGGDAKIAAAIALWLGFGQLLPFLVASAVIGGILTLLILSFRSRLLPAFALRETWITRLHDKKTGVPYGIALAAAALLLFPNTPFLQLMAATG